MFQKAVLAREMGKMGLGSWELRAGLKGVGVARIDEEGRGNKVGCVEFC